ncbi:hypothetical protein [Tahibacter caeni]|uniref:hypothetical protein n=1 Tax=Tahibacter caeni TaxID=1453545 RepID=UPI002148AA51|nr:hypothetical protein [Tahibacter caeni]
MRIGDALDQAIALQWSRQAVIAPDVISAESRNSVGVRRLVMAGKNLNTVRELIGYADIATTLRYGPFGTEHKRRAVDAPPAPLGSGGRQPGRTR